MVTHFDRCLGCMACVTACPSGVRYDRLIERVRPQVERHHNRARPSARCAGCCSRRSRTQAAACAGADARRGPQLGAERVPERLSILMKVAPSAPRPGCRAATIPERTPRSGEPRGRVGLLLGCVQRVFYRRRASRHDPRSRRRGLRGARAPAPDCCGALEFHSGEEQSGDPPRARDDRGIRPARSARQDRRQRGRLRLRDEGVRRAARHPRPHVRSPSRVCDVSELLAEVEPARPTRPGADTGRLSRRLPPRPRPGGPRSAAASCCARSPGSNCSRTPSSPPSAAARPASTTCSSPRLRPSSAPARRAT